MNDSQIDAQPIKATQNSDSTSQGFNPILPKESNRRDVLGLPRDDYFEWLEKRRNCAREWNRNNKERQKFTRTSSLKSLRKQVIAAYGGKCACCYESTFEFLTIDHKSRNGKADRLEKKGTYGVYRWLVKNNFPTDNYRCLCMNCNWAARVNGVCPHSYYGFRREAGCKKQMRIKITDDSIDNFCSHWLINAA